MRLLNLRDRDHARRALDPSDHRFVTGSPEQQREARAEYHRQLFAAKVFSSDRTEIPRSDLAAAHFGLLEDTRDGAFYRTTGGDPFYLENATHYYVNADGAPILLEPAGTRAELEQARADREARRNTPKPKPAWMR